MRPGVRIGVDVGAVRLGIALSDPAGILATPHATLPARAERLDGAASGTGYALAALVDLAREREVLEVVVGLPRGLSGVEGAAAAAARDFACELAQRIRPVPVRLVDERLSTVEAHRALRASGRPGRRHREVVDQVAAVTILQTALELERALGSAPGEAVGVRKPRHRKGALG
ncbi:MAG: Holliday junction resolvase RuvX [Micrococcales bacterium]|nr:Holliday junction resolvase RuvX [Micrococcales bacterium]